MNPAPSSSHVLHHCPSSVHRQPFPNSTHPSAPPAGLMTLAVRATTQGCPGYARCSSLRHHRLECGKPPPGVVQCSRPASVHLTQDTEVQDGNMTPIPKKPPDTTINHVSTCSSHAEIFKAMDPFRVGGPGAFCNGTERHSVLGVVMGGEVVRRQVWAGL